MEIVLCQFKHYFVFVMMALLLSACGSSSDSDSAIEILDGTWQGSIEERGLVMHRFRVDIFNGEIIALMVDGVDQGLSGIIRRETDNVFAFTLSNGVEGGFIVDPMRKYAAFVDELFNVGVLQLDAGTLPAYAQADLAGSASGSVVNTNLSDFDEFDGSISCDIAGNCSGSDDRSGNFNTDMASPLTLNDVSLGRWSGRINFNGGGSASLSVFLSPDKRFASAWACNFAAGSFPLDCSFAAWMKN